MLEINMITWKKIKKFINAHEKFNRKRLQNHISPFNEISITNMDTYRRFLIRAGYVEQTGRGEYRRIKKIPENLQLRDCRKKD